MTASNTNGACRFYYRPETARDTFRSSIREVSLAADPPANRPRTTVQCENPRCRRLRFLDLPSKMISCTPKSRTQRCVADGAVEEIQIDLRGTRTLMRSRGRCGKRPHEAQLLRRKFRRLASGASPPTHADVARSVTASPPASPHHLTRSSKVCRLSLGALPRYAKVLTNSMHISTREVRTISLSRFERSDGAMWRLF